MNTLIRTATFTLSRRSVDGYGPLDQSNEMNGGGGGVYYGKSSTSKREKETHKMMMMNSLSYRRDRARKRQVFLKTYNLSSIDINGGRKSVSRMIRKVLVKAKSCAVLAVSSCFRIGSLRSSSGDCRSSASICASSPVPVQKGNFNAY